MIRTKGRSDLDLIKKRHRKDRGPWTLWVNRTKKKELTLDSLPLPKLLENYDKGAQIQVAKSPLTNRLEDPQIWTHSRHVHCIEIYQLRTIDIRSKKTSTGWNQCSCRFDEKERHSRSFTCDRDRITERERVRRSHFSPSRLADNEETNSTFTDWTGPTSPQDALPVGARTAFALGPKNKGKLSSHYQWMMKCLDLESTALLSRGKSFFSR